MVDQAEIHRMAWSEDVKERKRAVENIQDNTSIRSDDDKKLAWNDLIRLTSDKNGEVRRGAADALGSAFSYVPDKKLAWDDLIRLASDKNREVRRNVAYALGRAFSHVPDKKKAWNDLILLTSNNKSELRRSVANALGSAFSHAPDKKQAWNDLHRLTSKNDSKLRRSAADALGIAFSHVPDKKQAWDDLHWLTQDKVNHIQWFAVTAIDRFFTHIPDKKQAWNDLIRLAKDGHYGMGLEASDALGNAFLFVQDKKAAWKDLHQLTKNKFYGVRLRLAIAIGYTFSHNPNKKQAWDDLHRLASDTDPIVRGRAANAFGHAFSHISDKNQTWKVLIHLAMDDDSLVRTFADYSLGRASIFKATEAGSREDFDTELKNALEFFEKSLLESTVFNPAKFCHPFYRSFYILTFKKEDAEAEIQKCLKEAKSAVEGSESKEKLLEVVENLGNALKEGQKSRDFDAMKSDLNAYRRYCERACELLDTTEEKAPGASKLIRKGLPIIDDRIKGIIAEIQEKAKTLCKQTKGTTFEDLGKNVYRIGQNLLVENPVILEKRLNDLQISLSAIYARTSEINVGEACDLLKRANNEPILENRIQLMDDAISKILPHIGNVTNIQISNSNNVQITTANGTTQKMSIEIPEEKTIK